MDDRVKQLSAVMQARYGVQPTHVVTAPGRVELGGNHTDHNHGKVLAASVDLAMVAVAAATPDNYVTVFSDARGEQTINLDRLDPIAKETGTSASLVRGIARFLNDANRRIGGALIVMDSQVLPGSGLSSSAAFEVLIGGVQSALYNDGSVTPVELATIGQKAENLYFDKPSGLMDQLASAVGGVIAIDFAASEPKIESLPFDLEAWGYELVIVNSRSSHANLTPAYAAITEEMGQIAAYFGKKTLREVNPAAFFDSIKALRALGNDRAVLRAIHYFGENERVPKMLHALQDGNLARYFALVTESGHSSGLVLQNTKIEGQPDTQPINLALALSEHFLQGEGATRIQGGGFAGTIQTYVPMARVGAYISFMDRVFGAESCAVVRFRNKGVSTAVL